MQINLQLSKKLFNELPYQYLFDYSHRFEVWFGGAGSGKSFGLSQKILLKALNDKRKVLIIRKTLVSQKDSCWRLFIELLGKWQISEYCKIRVSDYTIELPNGSILLFKGLDDSERIKSIVGITDIWVEESTELNEEEFDQLNLRLRAKADNLQVFCSFNPISKANWVYKRWFDEKALVAADTLIVKSTYKDNKFLPQDYIDSLEKMMKTNPTYYKIYALGEFCSLDKLVYNNWKVEDFNSTEINGELLLGLDFGFVNDTAALVASIIDEPNKKIYVFKEWGATNKTNPELADVIRSLGFAKSTIIADSAEQKSIEEIKRAGIYRIKESVKGPDSIIHGIQKLQQYELVISPICTEIVTELENYSWQKDKQTNEYINKPIDAFNHYLDALRYSLQCVNSSKLKTVNKSILGL